MKNRILAHFPDLTAHKEGHNILLAFNNDLGADPLITTIMMKLLFSKSSKHCTKRHAKNATSFAGSFDLDCQVRSMPHSLSVMVAMILNGPNFKYQGCDGVSQASISIAQLLQYHISVRQRLGSTGIYHQNTRETPLPIYVGLVVHARTRKRDLIETLFYLGLSISYDRVMEISTTIGNHISAGTDSGGGGSRGSGPLPFL